MAIQRNHSNLLIPGTSLILSVTIRFRDEDLIDVPTHFVIEWRRINNPIESDDRITVSDVDDDGRATLTYSPLAFSDRGWIIATVTIHPSNDFMYIQSTNATAFHDLNVYGM